MAQQYVPSTSDHRNLKFNEEPMNNPDHTAPTAFRRENDQRSDDTRLLPNIVAAVERVGKIVGASYESNSRPRNFDEIRQLIDANDKLGGVPLKEDLIRLRPNAGWAEEDDADGALPPGEWWITDPCEGNINKVHGVADFCTSATLVRDNRPVAAAVHLPLAGVSYAAVAGGNSFENGKRIKVAEKSSLNGAFIATCQNGPNERRPAALKLGKAVTEFLLRNAIVRVSPPPTLQLLPVACGRLDGFFLFGAERAGVLAGALLAFEAGGVVTDVRGNPWTLSSEDIVVAAPGVHADMIALLTINDDALVERASGQG